MHVRISSALMASPRRASSFSSARAFVTRTAARISTVVAEFRATAPVPVAAEPADVFGPDELPELDVIEAAAASYFRAADQARTADRAKRAARKLIDRLPSGRFGAWDIERIQSGRQTADLDEIKRIFKAHGLGAIPMKSSAPTLKVRRVQVDVPALVEAELAALAGVR